MKRGLTEKNLTYIGWLGHGNLGDEALFQINQKVFDKYQLIPDTEEQHSKITLFGGGTLLPNWPCFIMPNKYNFAFGVGVKDPRFWREFSPFTIKQIKRFKFRFLGVRGFESKRILEKWGIASKVIGDPCLLYECKPLKRNARRTIVNVDFTPELWGSDQQRVFNTITNFCKILKKDSSPILLPLWKESIPYVRQISHATDIPIFKHWSNVDEVLRLLASSWLLIGEKLHSLVLSAATYTPFITLEYDPKCRDFVETLGMEKYILRTNEVTVRKLKMLWQDASGNWDRLHGSLIASVTEYRKKLKSASHDIITDIDSLPQDKWSPPRFQNIKGFLNRNRIRLWKIERKIWKIMR